MITPVNNGKIEFDGYDAVKQQRVNYPEVIYEELMIDYVLEYFKDKKFRFAELINDDFFEAIRVTFNKKLYVSSIKLMMSSIDTFSFLEYGESNFKKWLDTYADLTPLNINSEELWEFRNSMLHMTNLDSKKVIKCKVQRIQFYISKEDAGHFKQSDEAKYFNYVSLITIIAKAIEQWGNTYLGGGNKIDEFVGRYDRIISDKRYGYVKVE